MGSFELRFRQCGSILLLTMLFLVLSAIVAQRLMQAAALESRMAANHQFREEARQRVKGAVRSLSAQSELLQLDQPAGQRRCLMGDTRSVCDVADIPNEWLAGVEADTQLRASVVKVSDNATLALPVREAVAEATSVRLSTYALFEVEVISEGGYPLVQRGHVIGTSRVVRGLALRQPVAGGF